MDNQSPAVSLLPIGEADGILTISSTAFAEGLGIQHKNLLETISNHKEAIEKEFGLIAFETEAVKKPGARGTKYLSVAHLTEEQALFTGTLSKNSKRVVEFKATLVRSFSEARKRLLEAAQNAPVLLSAEQVLLQQAHRLVDQQSQIDQLRLEVAQILAGANPPRPSRRLTAPVAALPHKQAPTTGHPVSNLRTAVTRKVNEYCTYHSVTQQETYLYLYRRMAEVYGINVHKLTKAPGDSLLDALERYGHLDRLYSLVMAEIIYPDESNQLNLY